jgi:hypothetical protein
MLGVFFSKKMRLTPFFFKKKGQAHERFLRLLAAAGGYVRFFGKRSG